MSSVDPEMEFVSGKIFEIDLPQSQQYLWKYFKTRLQRQFIKYYLTYRSYLHFTDHTGYYCSDRWVRALKIKLQRLERAHEAAQDAARRGDFEPLALIQSGKYKVR